MFSIVYFFHPDPKMNKINKVIKIKCVLSGFSLENIFIVLDSRKAKKK